MSARSYDLLIVGLGSAGLVAADFGARLGLKVGAVESGRVGGDCLWGGCVPSKALLASARAADTMRHADRYGLPRVEPEIDTTLVLERIRRIQAGIQRTDDNPELLAAKGVEVHLGAGRLSGPTSVQVEGGGELRARFILLCTGSRPSVPPISGLEGSGYLTSDTFWEQERLPASLVVIGGGPIAAELSQACVRLGTSVTVLQRGERLLPRDEPALAERVAARLRADGVEIVYGAEAEEVSVSGGGERIVRARVGGALREFGAAEVLVAAGRAPNVKDLGLAAAGVETDDDGIAVDGKLRTSVPTIYAAGDLAGRYRFTHTAGYEAGIAVRNMFVPLHSKATEHVPWCTFTDPELAHVGMTEAEARSKHRLGVRVWRLDLSEVDRARTDDATEGEIRIVTVWGKVKGAHVLAPNAGDLIGELTLAIDRGRRLIDLAQLIHVYPTQSVAFSQLGGEATYALTDRLRRLIRSKA